MLMVDTGETTDLKWATPQVVRVALSLWTDDDVTFNTLTTADQNPGGINRHRFYENETITVGGSACTEQAAADDLIWVDTDEIDNVVDPELCWNNATYFEIPNVSDIPAADEIFVGTGARQGQYQKISTLTDVTPASGDFLLIEDATGNTIGRVDWDDLPGGSSTLAGLTDTTSPADLHILIWDQTGSQTWENVLWGGDVSITLAGVTSVDNTKCTATDEYLDGLGNCDTLGGGTHEILSGTHTDSTAASVVRGDLITGQLATPKWQRLAMGTINQFLGNDGTDVAWEDIVLASAHFANQGTTTTVLHGNAAGNPTWGAVDLTADVSGDLPYTNLAQMGAYTLMLNNSAGTADPAAVKITGLTLEGSPEALDFIMIERADGTLAYSDIGNLPGGGTPGGSDTHVQFNDATAFGGESTFTYNKHHHRPEHAGHACGKLLCSARQRGRPHSQSYLCESVGR
jgi:hypothetical protein